MSRGLFKEIDRGLEFFSPFGLLFEAAEGIFDHLQVGESEFQGDDFDIVEGIDAAGDMDDVRVFKAANDLNDGIGLTDMGKELVSKPFTLRGAFDQAGDIDKAHCGRDDLFAVGLLGEDLEARVVEIDDAEIGVDGAKRVVFRGDLLAGQGIKKSRFADIGKPHNAAGKVCHILPVSCVAKVKSPAARARRMREEDTGSPLKRTLGMYSSVMPREDA
jgi:hypothetical protein